eukprot:symbB.v1.2.006184.t1/scaffold367.1/size382069/17
MAFLTALVVAGAITFSVLLIIAFRAFKQPQPEPEIDLELGALPAAKTLLTSVRAKQEAKNDTSLQCSGGHVFQAEPGVGVFQGEVGTSEERLGAGVASLPCNLQSSILEKKADVAPANTEVALQQSARSQKEGCAGLQKIHGSQLGPLQFLSEGSFAQIFRSEIEGSSVALKRLKDPEAKEDFLHEVSLLHRLRHPRIVLLVGVYVEAQELCIVMEWRPWSK